MADGSKWMEVIVMESISVGDITTAVTVLVGFIGGIGYLKKSLKIWIAKALENQLESIDAELKGLASRLDRVDMESCKNFIVRCLADFENNIEISETEVERFWEQYEHYEKVGGNSYIKQKVEKLKKDGKL